MLEAKIAAEDKSASAFVFACEGGAPPGYRNAARALTKVVKAAKIEFDKETERVSFHVFRHAAVSALIRAAVDPVRVANFVGDKVQTILTTYAQEWATDQDDDLSDVLGDAMAGAS
jgi:integrase